MPYLLKVKQEIFMTDVTNFVTSLKKVVQELNSTAALDAQLQMAQPSVRYVCHQNKWLSCLNSVFTDVPHWPLSLTQGPHFSWILMHLLLYVGLSTMSSFHAYSLPSKNWDEYLNIGVVYPQIRPVVYVLTMCSRNQGGCGFRFRWIRPKY